MTTLDLVFVILGLAAAVADGVTTYLALKAGGRERMPLMGGLIRDHGLAMGLLLGKGVQSLGVVLIGLIALSNPGAAVLLAAPVALYAYVSIGNLAVAREMRRRRGE